MRTPATRLYAIGTAVLLQMLTASPARAQFRPRNVNQGAIGENYHIEFGAAIWDTSADITLSNTALDLAGSTIDLKNDLGIRDQKFGAFDLILRPGQKHKFRVQLVPVHYSATAAPRS